MLIVHAFKTFNAFVGFPKAMAHGCGNS